MLTVKQKKIIEKKKRPFYVEGENDFFSKLNERLKERRRCVHCGKYFEPKDKVETHQSNYCPECQEAHRGVEIIE